METRSSFIFLLCFVLFLCPSSNQNINNDETEETDFLETSDYQEGHRFSLTSLMRVVSPPLRGNTNSSTCFQKFPIVESKKFCLCELNLKDTTFCYEYCRCSSQPGGFFTCDSQCGLSTEATVLLTLVSFSALVILTAASITLSYFFIQCKRRRERDHSQHMALDNF